MSVCICLVESIGVHSPQLAAGSFIIDPRMKMMGPGLGGASMEAGAKDSLAGERVAAVVDSQSGGRFAFTAGLRTYDHANQVMDGWIEPFHKVTNVSSGNGKI